MYARKEEQHTLPSGLTVQLWNSSGYFNVLIVHEDGHTGRVFSSTNLGEACAVVDWWLNGCPV